MNQLKTDKGISRAYRKALRRLGFTSQIPPTGPVHVRSGGGFLRPEEIRTPEDVLEIVREPAPRVQWKQKGQTWLRQVDGSYIPTDPGAPAVRIFPHHGRFMLRDAGTGVRLFWGSLKDCKARAAESVTAGIS